MVKDDEVDGGDKAADTCWLVCFGMVRPHARKQTHTQALVQLE